MREYLALQRYDEFAAAMSILPERAGLTVELVKHVQMLGKQVDPIQQILPRFDRIEEQNNLIYSHLRDMGETLASELTASGVMCKIARALGRR